MSLSEDVRSLLSEIANDEDDLLIHGLGSDIDLMPPGRVAMVLQQAFEENSQLRLALAETIAATEEDVGVRHGAIKIFKKLGADPFSASFVVEPLVDILLTHEPDPGLYSNTLTLLSYCVSHEPVPAPKLRRLRQRCGELESNEDLTKFNATVRLLTRNGWFDQDAAEEPGSTPSDSAPDATSRSASKPECIGCSGSGKTACDECKGTGRTRGFLGLFAKLCPLCNGSGDAACDVCGGTG